MTLKLDSKELILPDNVDVEIVGDKITVTSKQTYTYNYPYSFPYNQPSYPSHYWGGQSVTVPIGQQAQVTYTQIGNI